MDQTQIDYKAVAAREVKVATVHMSEKYCPIVKNQCFTDGCIHFQKGWVHTFEERHKAVPPKCKLWK